MVSYAPSQFQNFMNFLGPTRQPQQGIGFGYSQRSPYITPGQQTSFGEQFSQNLNQRAHAAQQNYVNQSNQRNVGLATDILGKSGGTIPVDSYGRPVQQLTDFSSIFNNQLKSTRDIGNLATQAAEARNAWANANKMQNIAAGSYGQAPVTNLPAGAAPNNPGARAVALAQNVVKNHTPYLWGGNSLKNGVDCSGLTQQIYSQLGIKLPRTTYEQAKSGRFVNRNQLLPGDLIFYNTGSRDPNGIGTNGHVALYIGNGQVIEAAGRGTNVRISGLDSPGQYHTAIRPW